MPWQSPSMTLSKFLRWHCHENTSPLLTAAVENRSCISAVASTVCSVGQSPSRRAGTVSTGTDGEGGLTTPPGATTVGLIV